MRNVVRAGAVAAVAGSALLVWGSASAQAGDPPGSWTNLRVLDS